MHSRRSVRRCSHRERSGLGPSTQEPTRNIRLAARLVSSFYSSTWNCFRYGPPNRTACGLRSKRHVHPGTELTSEISSPHRLDNVIQSFLLPATSGDGSLSHYSMIYSIQEDKRRDAKKCERERPKALH